MPEHPSSPVALLTEQQLADQWQTTVGYIKRLRSERGLPFVKVGRYIRLDPADVARWLAAQKSTTAA